MKVIVCLDDKKGLMFNKRRQSQDKIARNYIKEMVKSHKFYMNSYSYKLYKDIDQGNIKVDENFLDNCNDTDFCLVEDKHLSNYINKISETIIFNWNRVYPADLYFDIDLKDASWKLIQTEEFTGSSHEKITKEIYRRIY